MFMPYLFLLESWALLLHMKMKSVLCMNWEVIYLFWMLWVSFWTRRFIDDFSWILWVRFRTSRFICAYFPSDSNLVLYCNPPCEIVYSVFLLYTCNLDHEAAPTLLARLSAVKIWFYYRYPRDELTDIFYPLVLRPSGNFDKILLIIGNLKWDYLVG